MGITFSYLFLCKYFLHQNDENTTLTGNYGYMNNQCTCLVYLYIWSEFSLKLNAYHKGCCKNMFPFPLPHPNPQPLRPKMPYGGDTSLTYVCNIYEWELGSMTEGTYFYNNFYETHSILHFNWKWERDFKPNIQETRTECIHLISVVSSSVWCKKYLPKRKVLVVLRFYDRIYPLGSCRRGQCT